MLKIVMKFIFARRNLANAQGVPNLINTGAVPDSIPFLNTGLYRR